MFDPKIGDRCKVQVHTWRGDSVLFHPPIPCKVISMERISGGTVRYVVTLLQNSVHGWYVGDTYRARYKQLLPLDTVPLVFH